MSSPRDSLNSLSILVSGRVQGVGFRPFIYRLASSLGLKGFVENTRDGVQIEVHGHDAQLKKFQQQLVEQAPPNSQIDKIRPQRIDLKKVPARFKIIDSAEPHTKDTTLSTEVSPDLSICADCLTELFDSSNRRYLHPFISCTNCGPRFSLITDLPYDRKRTSMAQFDHCEACQEEYVNPEYERRFHSQTNACPACGPTLSLHHISESTPTNRKNHDAIEECAKRIKQGELVAIKGIGGFHLVCDARNAKSVTRLRAIKKRPDKPFALMALNCESLTQLVELNQQTTDLLTSATRPIVLAPKKSSEEVLAPNLQDLGCMLPYTPIHYLLFHALLGRPKGQQWLSEHCSNYLLVTSANLPNEPIIYQDAEILKNLHFLADAALLHDREIISPCDDSVIQSGHPISMFRRSRGLAPSSFALGSGTPNGLACGAHLKNTFCLVQNGTAYLSPYLGELDNPVSYERYRNTIMHYQRLFGDKIEQLTCDLHPDYLSTHYAEKVSRTDNLHLSRAQHHHAHFSATIAEKGGDQEKPSLGLILDGYGFGSDKSAWGGELFLSCQESIKHIGQLEKLAMPGGDKASREIWKLGVCLLSDFDKTQAAEHYRDHLGDQAHSHFLLEGLHAKTSSAGRWFDSVASLLGLRQVCSFEGQAAAELESLASQNVEKTPLSLVQIDEDNQLLLRPLIPHLLTMNDPASAARAFHVELIDGIARWLDQNAQALGVQDMYFSGGCFQNRILREGINRRLTLLGYTLYFPTELPSNDGGLSLGQAYLGSLKYNQDKPCV